jgi:hypothetical protein
MEFLHDDGSQQVEVPLVDPSIFIERSLADY